MHSREKPRDDDLERKSLDIETAMNVLKNYRFRSRSYYYGQRDTVKPERSSFEPVTEDIEEQKEEKARRLPTIKYINDAKEDLLLRQRKSLDYSSLKDARSKSSDLGLPKVVELVEENDQNERKKGIKQYFALVDRAESSLPGNNSVNSSKKALVFSQETIEEQGKEENEKLEKIVSLSISSKSNSQRKIKVDEVEDDREGQHGYKEIEEVVEELDESDSEEKEMPPNVSKLSASLRRNRESLKNIIKSDLVCKNIVPLIYTEKQARSSEVPKIEEENQTS